MYSTTYLFNLKSVKKMYSKMCTVTTEKKLGSTSPLFATFYTSPALNAIAKYHLLYKQTSDQFSLAHLWGWGPLPLSFPITWYCKLDTGMQKPKLHPELQMQHKGCRWTCCSDLPISQALYQPGMVLNPEGPESLKWSTSSALPLQFTKQQPKVWTDLDPGTTQPEGNLTPL